MSWMDGIDMTGVSPEQDLQKLYCAWRHADIVQGLCAMD